MLDRPELVVVKRLKLPFMARGVEAGPVNLANDSPTEEGTI